MQVKAFLFDFFGVICSRVAPVWVRENVSEEAVVEQQKKLFDRVDVGNVSESEMWEELGVLSGKTSGEVQKEFLALAQIDWDLVEDIRNLAKIYKIGLCSNGASKFLRSVLEKNSLGSLFDVVVISSECGIVKPDPRIYKLALEQLTSDPQETIFIDDNQKNVEGAKRVGIKSILFVDGEQLPIQLSEMIEM